MKESACHDRREHGQKLFKKRFRLNVRKYAFSNRVTDNWNLLPVSCINCSTINAFKKHLHLSSKLESEAVKFAVVIVGIVRRKPVLTQVCGGMLVSVNSVNYPT